MPWRNKERSRDNVRWRKRDEEVLEAAWAAASAAFL